MQVQEKHKVLQDMQSGFRAGVSTTTSLLQFINALEQAEQKKLPLYCTSYDISKAFDRPSKGLIKLAWTRVGVPDDVAQWLVDLDIGIKSFIKSPWAQAQTKKNRLISRTTCPYFEQVMGVPQGSSEGGNTWLVIFDILLTMLKLRHVSRLYIQDTQGKLRPQNPTAFADDLLTYDPDQEGVQLHADVIPFFCMMTGLKIAPSKMVARATNVQSEAGHLSLNLWTINGERVQVPISSMTRKKTTLRYSGIWEYMWNQIYHGGVSTKNFELRRKTSPESCLPVGRLLASNGMPWLCVDTQH
jgi:hypothetical protein